MSTTADILVVDDDTALREMMRLTLVKEGYGVEAARSAAEATARLGARRFDLVLSDIYLGDAVAIDLLETIRRDQPSARVILVTAHGTVETAAEARRAGVFDYLAKPFRLETLAERVRAALRTPSRDGEDRADGPESMIVGSHPEIVEVYKAVARVAPLRLPVLVQGETGTGKELVARALHRFGPTPDGPFVPLNCGAIPSELIESELFGHVKGAFTGAVRDRPGAIESAAGGTLFLDEVGELPPRVQVRLLRFLQDGEVRPVGTERSHNPAVRVLAATHRDLASEAREDFYHRLAAYTIHLPPLRERKSDLPALAEHVRRRFADEIGRPLAAATPAALRVLEAHDWPGNVRELENVVRRAAIDLGGLADADGLRRLLDGTPNDTAPAPPPAIGSDLTLEELEKLHVEAVLRRCDGNRSRAARILGIERKSLYRKAHRLGIDLDPENE